MTICTICHFETELDDAAIMNANGRCVCLRCYARATDTAHPMPKTLRHALISVLEAIEIA